MLPSLSSFFSADCTGTGIPFQKIDRLLSTYVLPYYTNVHSNADGSKYMTSLINETRTIISSEYRISPKTYAIVFTGNGATCAARHLAHVTNYDRTVIIYTVLEHLSNSILWTALFPKAIKHVLDIDDRGFVNIDQLNDVLNECHENDKILLAITSCSNVTGVIQPLKDFATIIRQHRRRLNDLVYVVDLATSSPYLNFDLPDLEIDAAVISPHKMKGGYSTPGILIARRAIFMNEVPFFPGGGTVCYKSTTENDQPRFISDIEIREEGGTPNIIGIIKIGLLYAHKKKKSSFIRYKTQLVRQWADNEIKKIVGKYGYEQFHLMTPFYKHEQRLPIYSFIVKNVHYYDIVNDLSRSYGIQTRGGISCCKLLADKMSGSTKVPENYGWIRLSFFYDHEQKDIIKTFQALDNILRKRLSFT